MFSGKTYALPYFWGLDGMIYNKTRITTPPTSWMDVFKPEFKGKVGMLDTPESNVDIWARTLGYDPGTLTQDQLQKLTQLLIRLKTSQVRVFSTDMATIADAMVRGDVWIMASNTAINWPTLAPKGEKLAYVLPKEGGLSWIDTWVIAKGAPNLDTAYAYVNHMIDAAIQIPLGDAFVEATVNQQAVAGMSASNKQIFDYSNPVINTAAAPLFKIANGGGPNMTTYTDWTMAWQEVEAA